MPPSSPGSRQECAPTMWSAPHGSRTAVSGTGREWVGPGGRDPDAVAAAAEASELTGLVGAAARRVPSLADGGIAAGITGVYDMTPDARPMLGEVRPGLILAAGFSGMGFKISPAVGEALAELIVAGSASHVDLSPFRPGRFADGEPISPLTAYSDD